MIKQSIKQKQLTRIERKPQSTILDSALNHQATRIRIWSALERFANTGDSIDDYQRMAARCPSFWPLPVEDGRGQDLAWHEAAQPLFNFYRNSLQRLWVRDPVVLKVGPYTELLLGVFRDVYSLFADDSPLMDTPTRSTAVPQGLQLAIRRLKRSFPDARGPGLQPIASFWPDWNTGTVRYTFHTDFQWAVWRFFRESWRAKVCPQCSRYFIADKPAQAYCSPKCSNQAHLASAVRWWKEKGASRRAQRREGKI